MKKHLFLTGFMGVGKSHYGSRLANKLQLSFIDLDDEIENREGLSIFGIFTEKGAEYFRSIEKEILQSLLRSISGPSVISLGGGTLLNTGQVPQLKGHGLLVCLQRRTIALAGQVKADRPLAMNQKVEELYRERISGYSAAHACLRLDLFSENEALQHLINLWKYHVMDA